MRAKDNLSRSNLLSVTTPVQNPITSIEQLSKLSTKESEQRLLKKAKADKVNRNEHNEYRDRAYQCKRYNQKSAAAKYKIKMRPKQLPHEHVLVYKIDTEGALRDKVDPFQMTDLQVLKYTEEPDSDGKR